MSESRPFVPVITGTEAAFKELAATKKVLDLQQKNSYRQQEYITLLEGELDRTKSLVESKEEQLSTANSEIYEKTKKVLELESEVKTAHMEQTVFQRFAEQNKVLLVKFQEERKKCNELEEKILLLQQENNSLQVNVNTHTKLFGETEVNMTCTIRDLNHQLIIEKQAKDSIQDKLKQLQIEFNYLQNYLLHSDEKHVDEMSRTKQQDFKILLQVEDLNREYYKTKDMNENLLESLNQATVRGESLEQRLSFVATEAETMEEKMLIIYHENEKMKKEYFKNQHKLQKENISLQTNLNEARESISNLTRKCQSLLASNARLTALTGDSESICASTTSHSTLNSTSHSNSTPTSPGHVKRFQHFLQRDALIDDDSEINTATGTTSTATTTNLSVSESVPYTLTSPILGKRVLLSKYLMQISIASEKYKGGNFAASSLSSSVTSTSTSSSMLGDNERMSMLLQKEMMKIDLSRCGVTDEDIPQLIEWFHLIPIRNICFINLKKNLVTVTGLRHIVTWLLSLSPEEYTQRESTLVLDLSANK
eukprot:gene13072-27589_t